MQLASGYANGTQNWMSLQRTVYAVRQNMAKFFPLQHTNGVLLVCIATAAFSPDAFFIKADKPVRI